MRTLLAPLLVLGIALPAASDTPPPRSNDAPVDSRTLGNEGQVRIGTLCWGQTAASTGCTYLTTNGGNGDEIVADLRGYNSVTLFSNQSTATTYTCDAYISDNGYDGDSGVGTDRTTSSLTETQEAVFISGVNAFLWVECSAIADNSVIVTFVASK